MSYSNLSHAASAYREREVLSASPARLVVMVYDHVLANLHRARAATQHGNLPARLEALTNARAGIRELLGTLNLEKGGALGANLQAIYGFVHTQLVDEVKHADPVRLERVTKIVAELRSAFDAISNDGKIPAVPAA